MAEHFSTFDMSNKLSIIRPLGLDHVLFRSDVAEEGPREPLQSPNRTMATHVMMPPFDFKVEVNGADIAFSSAGDTHRIGPTRTKSM